MFSDLLRTLGRKYFTFLEELSRRGYQNGFSRVRRIILNNFDKKWIFHSFSDTEPKNLGLLPKNFQWEVQNLNLRFQRIIWIIWWEVFLKKNCFLRHGTMSETISVFWQNLSDRAARNAFHLFKGSIWLV